MNLRGSALSGYTWALASTACLGTVYIFSKSALGSLSQATFLTFRAGNVVLVAFLLAIFVHTLFRALSYLIAKPVAAQIGSEVLLGFRNLVMFLSAAVFAVTLARDQLQPPSIHVGG